MTIREGKLLYHLTTLDALESIIENGLLSRGELNRRGIRFDDTANHEILAGRERLGLSNYVPFHFHIHTKYDTYVKSHHSDKVFIYLCLQREYARSHGFSIIPRHPTSGEEPQLFSYDEGFERINWDVMELRKTDSLPDGITEHDRGLIRMAECLSANPVPISDFIQINVKDEESKFLVCETLYNNQIRMSSPHVNIMSCYF